MNQAKNNYEIAEERGLCNDCEFNDSSDCCVYGICKLKAVPCMPLTKSDKKMRIFTMYVEDDMIKKVQDKINRCLDRNARGDVAALIRTMLKEYLWADENDPTMKDINERLEMEIFIRKENQRRKKVETRDKKQSLDK